MAMESTRLEILERSATQLRLRMGAETLKLLQFTDLHLQHHTEEDEATRALMRRILAEERPDLVVVTGDTLCGPGNLDSVPWAFAPLAESGIPWTFTFGNHDTEEGHGQVALYRAISALSGCIAPEGTLFEGGRMDHSLVLEDEAGRPRHLLQVIDSGDYHPDGGWAALETQQIEASVAEIRRMRDAVADLNVMIYMHIPVHEYERAWAEAPGSGQRLERVCHPRVNTGYFDALRPLAPLAIFVGHDHINDFVGTVDGITLGYGRAGGYGTYGRPGFARGARLFELRRERPQAWRTHVVLERDPDWIGTPDPEAG